MNVHDILNSSGEEANSDMETMDVSLNCDDPELMSSEFFDSVLSLENNMDDEFFSKFEDDINLSSDASSHLDEVLSPQSYTSESDKNSSYMENIEDSRTILDSVNEFDESLLMSLIGPSDDQFIKTEPEIAPTSTPSTPVQKKTTQILIQNPNNKKFISKPLINASHLKSAGPLNGKPQILKVQPISNNGKTVLFPLNIKSIKILNTPEEVAAFTGNMRKRKIEPTSGNKNVAAPTSQYPPLSLTLEEKRLLAKEGIQLPSHHPLTKNEERELKRIRRKIRNKISAQDSRKRKKEYVDGLEERVKRGSEENKNLLQRVRALQKQNKTLIAHVNKLQALICNSTTSKATPSTCLMVVLLSALLVSLPNMKLFENKQSHQDQEQISVRRSLLSSPQATDDNLNMEEFLIFKDDEDYEGKLIDEIDVENSTEKEVSKILEEMGQKYDGLLSEKNNSNKSLFGRVLDTFKNFLERDKKEVQGGYDYGGFNNKKVFLEPDIDEYVPIDHEPPIKKSKMENSDSFNSNDDFVTTTTMNANNFVINTKDK
nr:cyclic AMP-responsive element-binding protein 3-like protein 3-A isoform X1 [Leptinotarsa decemlineata]